MKNYFFLILSCLLLFSFKPLQGLEKDIDSSQLNLIISENEIRKKILHIASNINNEYENKEIVIIFIMKGSFIFTADLIRELNMPVTIDTIKCSSYGKNGMQNIEFRIEGLDKIDITNKHVILVDDIFDTGQTLSKVISKMKEKNPKSLKSVVLILKDTTRRLKKIDLPDYYLFEIPDKFLVGYGLDYKGYFRGMKHIYSISEK